MRSLYFDQKNDSSQIEDETYSHIIIMNLDPKREVNPAVFDFLFFFNPGAPLWWRTVLQLCSPIPEPQWCQPPCLQQLVGSLSHLYRPSIVP